MSENEHGQTFPMPVQHGSVTVLINRIRKKNGYQYFQIRYYDDGVRKAKTCSHLADAEKQAKDIAKKLHEGEGRVIHLHGRDRTSYLQAKAALSPIQIPLELATHEYRLAHDLLAGKVGVLEAVRCYAEQNIEPVDPKPVPEILKELLKVRAKEGASTVHLKDLGSRLTRFASEFTGLLSAVSAAQIHDFILSLNVEPRTRNNFRMAISNLVGFARYRRYVPRNYNPMPEVPRAKEVSKPVEIFTVEEMTKLLQNAKPILIPFLCLVAFGGLRHEEAARLDWSDYMNGHIHISARLAKCREPRKPEVLPNLAAWLEPFRKKVGPVQPFANVNNELQELSMVAGIVWKRNGLRHAFASYRLADIKNPDQVAYEMGNSRAMVYKHYRALVTEAEGKRWFGIMPAIAANILALPSGTVAG